MKRVLLLALMVLGVPACSRCASEPPPAEPPAPYLVEPVHMLVPRVPGWTQDTAVPPFDGTKGGLVLRLTRESAVAGSPRFDVVVEPPRPETVSVEDVLTRNLQEMGALEQSGAIKIIHVEQRRVAVGSQTAYRVQHEYTVGAGTAQASINQVSTFVVLEGRGVAVTAAGRTELYHPLADSIETMMHGLKSSTDTGGTKMPPDVVPEDLGKVGGKH